MAEAVKQRHSFTHSPSLTCSLCCRRRRPVPVCDAHHKSCRMANACKALMMHPSEGTMDRYSQERASEMRGKRKGQRKEKGRKIARFFVSVSMSLPSIVGVASLSLARFCGRQGRAGQREAGSALQEQEVQKTEPLITTARSRIAATGRERECGLRAHT